MDTKQIKQIDSMAVDIAEMVYSDSLQSLESTLNEFDVNSRAYTILGIRDDSVCLIFENGDWVTFYYERGQRAGESHFTDIDDACKEVLRSVGIGRSREHMQSHFISEMERRAKRHPSSKEFQESLRKGLERISASVAL